jgi:hypothetical protein
MHEVYLYVRYRWDTAELADYRPESTPKYDVEAGIDFTIKRF